MNIKFCLDDLNEHRTVKLNDSEDKSIKVYVSTYRDTEYKVIEFSDAYEHRVSEILK